jgi:hypothetical protein
VEFKNKVMAFAEEMLNLAAQWCYRIDDTSIRRWEKEETLYKAQRMMLYGGAVIKNCQPMTLVT